MSLLCFILGCQIALAPTTYQVKDACPDVKCWIEVLAPQYGVDVEVAMKIAERESMYGKYKTNWEGSSSKGVYQFIESTWANYCEGDVMNDKQNIECFMKLYNDHKSWWSETNY